MQTILPSSVRQSARRTMSTVVACTVLFSTILQVNANPVGPSVVAKANIGLWPEAINTPAGFDKASRAAILTYVQVLSEMQNVSDVDMMASFKIKSINRGSIEKWIKKEFDLSVLNYQRAASNCLTSDVTCLGKINSKDDLLKKSREWKEQLPASLLPWRENFTHFSLAYVSEQLRLAALFPKVSSEIDRFGDDEWNGDAMQDRQFLLTFDDGPTGARGSTDETLKMLENEKKSAVFFVLGSNFQTRLNATNSTAMLSLFKNQCMASHGWEHQSHAKWDQWENSIQRTHAIINNTFEKNSVLPFFRPPYGQRKSDSPSFFKKQGLQVALWNLDSQDWNTHVTSEDIVNRMTTLMLIKRHGVLLFHDVHPKAKTALPAIFMKLGNAVEWRDCHLPII